MRLEGRTALITGGARGIGRAFAEAYLREGARVAIADIDAARLGETADAIGAVPVVMDVTRQDSIDAGVAQAAEALGGGIDILINNAALFDLAPLTEVRRDGFEQLMAVNVGGVLFVMQAVARHMIARGRGGWIINIASQTGRRGSAPIPVYSATKAAVISLTQSAALELIRHRINVNAISPGVVEGELWDGVDLRYGEYEGKPPGQKKREVGAAVPYGRMGRAEDLTGMAIFLATEEAEYIVAQTYNVDGGNWMS